MGILYIDTGGNANYSGTTDDTSPITGTAATVAGSVVTLDGSPDLSGVSTSGATQAAIHLNDATNSNRKIFWITAVDNVAKTVTVDTAPTGVVSSAWAIGGRKVHTPAHVEAALRAGDIIQFNNSPVSSASAIITCRTSGTSAGGNIIARGKSGSRPVLTTSGSGAHPIDSNTQTCWEVSNLELAQTHASSGHGILAAGGWLIKDVKISDAGTHGVSAGATMVRVIACEITGTAGDGINASQSFFSIGNYIHDVSGDGIQVTGVGFTGHVINTIIDTAAARGLYYSAATTSNVVSQVIIGNTIYGCGDSGLEITDVDTVVTLISNIFQDNGNAAGEYNVEIVSGSTADLLGFHSHNCFYHAGGGGGANLLNLTANSTEVTTDPLFTNPASGDFTLGSTSPCKGTGFPGAFLGGPTGYMDMGAVQRQEPTGGGAGNPFGMVGAL